MRQQRVQVRELAMFTISWMSKIFQDCYARTMLHNLQCKEYKHGTQKLFHHCKSWTAEEIDCYSLCHSIIFETMCLIVFQTRMACRKEVPPWQRPKHWLSQENRTAAFKLVLAKLLLQLVLFSFHSKSLLQKHQEPLRSRHWHLDQPWQIFHNNSFYGLCFG